MNCEHCAIAETKPHHPTFAGRCSECAARMLAHSHEAKMAHKAMTMSPAYKHALINAFGEGWREAHASVKEWARKLHGVAS